MQKIRYWSCGGLVAGVMLSSSAMAQQNGRLTDSPMAPSVQTQQSLSAPQQVRVSPPVPQQVSAQTAASAAEPTYTPAVPAAEPAVAETVLLSRSEAVRLAAETGATVDANATPELQKGVAVWWDITPVGETTRDLMAAQAAGDQATSNPLPTLGVTAAESWNRYLESFRHPVPEWFKQHVEAVE